MMRLKKLSEDVYACLQRDITGWGYNNTGFIRKGGGLVIDSMWDLNFTQQMIDLFGSVCPPPYSYLVNTHANGDHCWGNQLFESAKIVAHPNCAEFMKTKSNPTKIAGLLSSPNPSPGTLLLKSVLREFDFSGITIVPPSILVEDKLEIDLDGLRCQIIYVGPAHTSSDLIVYLPQEGIVFASDVIFSHSTPIGWDGTLDKWLAALDLILDMEPRYIVPGHGPLCGPEEIQQNREYLTYLFDHSHDQFSKGLTEMEAITSFNLEHYGNWLASERLVMNVFWAYRVFRGNSELPPDIIAMFEQVHDTGMFKFNL